ncbi:MAG: hypothetical protein AAGF89_13720 [Bacteroidota bacterium]
MLRTQLFALLLLFSTGLSAQEFSVPKNIKLETKEDYIAQQDQVVAAVNWLQNTPVSQQAAKRKAVNAYLLQWLTGTPTVTLSLDGSIATFMECGDCLMMYMGTYAKSSIENGKTDELANQLAAVRAVMDLYTKNKAALGKNQGVEKYLKLAKKGKLESTLAKSVQ